MNYEDSLKEIEKTLEELKEKNKDLPIIVEGEKDVEALQRLGASGRIIRINQGISLSDFCDMIAREYKKVIILTDWDKKGGRLCMILKNNLAGRVMCNTVFRRVLAQYTTINSVEGLPSWIHTLRERLNGIIP